MKALLVVVALFLSLPAHADQPEISIPQQDIALIRAASSVDVDGTNANGQAETFTIHNAKALAEFIKLVTADHFVAVSKNLKPDFKSKSAYTVRFNSNGAPVFEFRVIGETVLDIPNDASYYMQSDRHPDLLMAPLRRLR